MMAVMEEEAKELLSYFNHRNVDALLRLTRNTLEMLRRRVNTPSPMHFAGEKLWWCLADKFLSYVFSVKVDTNEEIVRYDSIDVFTQYILSFHSICCVFLLFGRMNYCISFDF